MSHQVVSYESQVELKDLEYTGGDTVEDVDEKFDEPIKDESTWEVITSCRWVMAYVLCVWFTILYALRINMGVAMVCMVKPTDIGNETDGQTTGDIEWDKPIQGWVLSSFFYGYIVTQIPGGYMAGRFGGKRVMLVGIIIYGLSTVLLPFAAKFDGTDYTTSAYLTIALRVVAGLSTGIVFPAMQSLWGQWAPPLERSKLYVLSSSGTMIGNVVMLGLGGFFCEWESFDGGWPSMFYIGGGICLLFSLVWIFTIYDSPSQHPRITRKEREYILRSLNRVKSVKNKYVPWKEIFISPAVWAIIVAHVANNFGNYTLMTKLPAFMKEVLHFDIKSNGLYSMLPYIAMFIVANTVSNVIDKLRENNICRTVLARKTAMVIALVIPAGILVATGHIPRDLNYVGVIALTSAVAFTGFNRSGYNVNPQDIAPKYAGEIFGVSNTLATVPGMVAPLLVNYMTPNGTQEEWQIVFYVWAAVYCTGALVFTVFARGEIQVWAVESISSYADNEGFQNGSKPKIIT